MTDTPRTDAAINRYWDEHDDISLRETARQLERELAEAIALLEEIAEPTAGMLREDTRKVRAFLAKRGKG